MQTEVALSPPTSFSFHMGEVQSQYTWRMPTPNFKIPESGDLL